jgi:uncharacterized peroxidase-related enzyme
MIALNHYWKDEARVERLRTLDLNSCLEPNDLSLCEYARILTQEPSKIEEKQHIQPLRDHGFSDQAIVDAAGVVAYFNYVNRLVLGLGISLEADGGGGYDY